MLVELEVRELLRPVRVPRWTTSRWFRVSALKGARGATPSGAESIMSCSPRATATSPSRSARIEKAVPDADRGRVHDHRSRHPS